MRVTANTFPQSLVDQLSSLATRQNQLQNQAATGQRVQLPEDDPAAFRRTLDMQGEGRAEAQYRQNLDRLDELAKANFQVMKGLTTISDRAGELAILADGAKSPAQLETYGIEVTQLLKQAVQLANTKFRGGYLLSGTRSDQPPFVLSSNAAGQVTGVTYQGNDATAESEVAEGVTVAAGSLGANATGTGPRGLITDTRFGADFFNHLIALQDNLNAGDAAAITATTRPNLLKDEDNLILHFGINGTLQARLESMRGLSQTRSDSLEVMVSREVDADLAQTLVQLSQTQTAYQAALQSGATILSKSLLDYLR